jgi:hypothetical protein
MCLVFRLFWIFCAIAQLSFAGQNLISNGGFEDRIRDLPAMWNPDLYGDDRASVNFGIDSVGAYAGSWCARIENVRPNDAKLLQLVQTKPSTVYKLSCRIKARGVEADKTGASITVVDITETSPDVKETGDHWQYVELYGRTGSTQGRVTISLRLGFYGNVNTGVAWFDDVCMEEAVPPPGVRVINFSKDEPASGGPGSAKSSPKLPMTLIVFYLAALVLIPGVWLFRLRRARPESARPPESSGADTEKMTRTDYLVMGGLTLVYALIAFINLGTTTEPATWWKAANRGENVTLDLGAGHDIRQVKSFFGLGKGNYIITFSDDNATWRDGLLIGNKTAFEMIEWRLNNITDHTRYIKITADEPGAMLFELAFFGQPGGKPLPVSIINSMVGPLSEGRPANAFDEPKTVPEYPGFFNSMYFDETYHARTAFENAHLIEPSETTHPPLGKAMIALCVLLFGFTPFAWRLCGTTLGIGMVPIIYLFAKRVLKRTDAAFLVSFIFAFDFMHFVQTRIATIDTHGVFFIMLMFYFMHRYFTRDFFRSSPGELLAPLFWSGLFFGLGAASKWIAIYGGGGLAAVFCISAAMQSYSFLAAKNRLARKEKKTDKERAKIDTAIVKIFLRRMGMVVAWCVLSFVVIPVVIYVASYLPIMAIGGPSHGINYVLTNQKSMYDYHSQLKSTHPFSSNWWEWPFMRKPVWYYEGQFSPQGKVSSIVAMGNPAVWWMGILTVPLALVLAIRRKDRSMLVVFMALGSQYLPWIISPRKLVFIYHFFATVPFLTLCTGYVYATTLARLGRSGRTVLYVYCGLVLALFAAFYPILSGMLVDRGYVLHWLAWFPGWYFAR